jgi:hypothetical protein
MLIQISFCCPIGNLEIWKFGFKEIGVVIPSKLASVVEDKRISNSENIERKEFQTFRNSE